MKIKITLYIDESSQCCQFERACYYDGEINGVTWTDDNLRIVVDQRFYRIMKSENINRVRIGEKEYKVKYVSTGWHSLMFKIVVDNIVLFEQDCK